jgi:hypothetical protein
MASILCVLDRIKQDLRPFLPDAMIVSAAKQAGHRWRTRKFGPVETVHLFIVQVLNFNTAMTHLRHLSKKAVKAPAYCRARMRLPLGVQRQNVLPHRISFIDTLRWLLSAAPGEELPDLVIVPHRPDRHEPRVVKDREDTYTKMTRPRAQLRKELRNKPLTA